MVPNKTHVKRRSLLIRNAPKSFHHIEDWQGRQNEIFPGKPMAYFLQ